MEIVRKLAALCAVFCCNRTLSRTGLPHAPGPRAKLQATRVRAPRRWLAPSSGLCRIIELIGGCDEAGISRPRSLSKPTAGPEAGRPKRHFDLRARFDFAGLASCLARSVA